MLSRRRRSGEVKTDGRAQSFHMEQLTLCGVSKWTFRCKPREFNEDRSDITADGKLPAQLYGGTERVVSYLTEELVRQGHDVTLFASGDSITSARLEACCERALRSNSSVTDPIPDHLIMLDKVRQHGRSVRYPALSRRRSPLPFVPPLRRRERHDDAWAARHSRTEESARSVLQDSLWCRFQMTNVCQCRR